jgi:MFS superfamily sulfate permease-like transporter
MSAFLLSLVATGGVIFFGVLEGVVVAIALAVFMFFRRSWWPYGAVVGRIEGMGGWHSVEDHPDAREVPGVVIYRWEAPLFFANANSFRRQIRHLVKERQPRWVVLQCEAITDIDVTAGEILRELDDELNAVGIHVAFAEMRSRLQTLAQRYGLLESLDRDHFYPSVQQALDAIAAEEPPP